MSAVENYRAAKGAWDVTISEGSTDSKALHVLEDNYHQKALALIAHMCDDPGADLHAIKFIAQSALTTLSLKFDRWAA